MKRSHHHHHHHHQKGTTSSRFPKRRVINAFIYNFFLFTSGLAAGVILNSYIRNASFNLLHLTNFSNIISPSPNSPAPAAPIFPPSPSPTIQPPEATPFQPPIEDDHDQNDVVVHRVGLVEYLKVPDVRHDMEEEELLWRASMVSKLRKYPFKRVPKVAFLFLTKGPIVLHQMWEMFFKGVDQGLYSIYVHSNPFYSEPSDESPIFRGRRIPSKTQYFSDSGMGQSNHDGSRKTTASKRTTRHLKRTIHPPLRVMHTTLQLLDNLHLPHQLPTSLRGGIPFDSGTQPLHARHAPRGDSVTLEERVTVVRDR
ncbi:hypothetical protein LINPERHAP1_LOCUS35681 [Linum perenne]